MIAPAAAPDSTTKQTAGAVDETAATATDRAVPQSAQSGVEKSKRRLRQLRSAREDAQLAAARADERLRIAEAGVARTRVVLDDVPEPDERHRHALDSPKERQHRAAMFEFLDARAEREAERSELVAVERAEQRMVKLLGEDAEDAEAAAAEPIEEQLPPLTRSLAEEADQQRVAEHRKLERRAAEERAGKREAEKRAAEKRAAEKRKAEKQAAKKKKAEERAAAAQKEARLANRARPGTGAITSPYGMRVHPITGVEKLHSGTDFSAGDGNAYAARKGRVSAVTYDNGYGNMVTINHGNGVQTRYAHLADPKVQVGQRVNAGEMVGVIGSTGYSTGPHLHFEVLKHGEFRDSLNWLQR